MASSGASLAAQLNDFGSDGVRIYDFGTGALRQAGLGVTRYPVWHDAGRRLAVSNTRRGQPQGSTGRRIPVSRVVSRPVDFSEQDSTLAEFDDATLGLLDISPDGRYALFLDDTDPNPAITRLDLSYARLDGDSVAVDFEASTQDEFAARFSPDGRWVAYTSGESGRPHVYVRPFPGPGARVQVSLEPAGSPVWDPSGDRLFYRNEQGLNSAEVEMTEGLLRVTSRSHLFDLDFFGNVATRQAAYDVHPEGFVLAIDETGTNGQIVVWVNWLNELRALLAAENR
jgi:hypothetical protein